jgi:multidrug efflux pump subunit AcrA (membrane-fusion protein)
MKTRAIAAVGAGLMAVAALAAWGQGTKHEAPGHTTARVETAPLELTPPDRYNLPLVLEPTRRVAVMATADGVVRSLVVPLGAMVRENQEIIQLDRGEAAARLKIAQAEVKEMQAMPTGKSANESSIAQARVEAAQGRADLAQLELDRCTLRAPFSGRVLNYLVSPGQYVTKGTTLADLADVSSLRVLVPVERNAVKEGGSLELVIEGKGVNGKVQTMLPLPDTFAPLRELATPWAAAWVTFANADGKAHEPGQRVRDPFLPTAPIAVVPSRAVRDSEESAAATSVQVVRSEYVTSVPVRLLGPAGPERMQVSGPFRPADLAIVESTVPLVAGTLIRFASSGDGPVEGVAPKQGLPGVVADLEPPVGSAAPGSPGSRIAPIGAPDSRAPKSSRGTVKSTVKPANKGTSKPAAGGSGNAPF